MGPNLLFPVGMSSSVPSSTGPWMTSLVVSSLVAALALSLCCAGDDTREPCGPDLLMVAACCHQYGCYMVVHLAGLHHLTTEPGALPVLEAMVEDHSIPKAHTYIHANLHNLGVDLVDRSQHLFCTAALYGLALPGFPPSASQSGFLLTWRLCRKRHRPLHWSALQIIHIICYHVMPAPHIVFVSPPGT